MGLDHVNYFSKNTMTKFLGEKGFRIIKIKSSIEVKLFLMYAIYNKKRKKKEGKDIKITAADRQKYYNKKVNKPKWILIIMIFIHNMSYNLLSFLKIGDEMFVIAQKQ